MNRPCRAKLRDGLPDSAHEAVQFLPSRPRRDLNVRNKVGFSLPACVGRNRAALAGLLLGSLVALSLNAPPSVSGVDTPRASTQADRGPILIDGNLDFTAANGVTSGSGTAGDPFVIVDHRITAEDTPGVRIRNTTAPFVIRNVSVSPVGSTFRDGIVLANVTDGAVEASTVYVSDNSIRVADSQRVRINGSQTGGLTGLRIESSSNVTVEDNGLGFGSGVGLWIVSSEEVLASRNVGESYYGRGSVIEGGSRIALSANRFLGGDVGLRAVGTRSLRLEDNLIRARDGPAVDLQRLDGFEARRNEFVGWVSSSSSSNVTLAGNNMTGFWLQGVVPHHWTSHSISSDNLARGRPILYRSNCRDLVLDGLEAAQVIVAGCSGVRLANLTLEAGFTGLLLAHVDDATIVDSRIRPGYDGIHLHEVRRATFTGVTVAHATFPFWWGGPATSGILFHGNNFIHNYNEPQAGPPVAWNAAYPIGGNYWSAPLAPDRCRGPAQDDCSGPDGFADRAVSVGASNDRYPLKVPKGIPPELPTGDFSWYPSPILVGTTVTFVPLNLGDPDGVVERIDWDFGDGILRQQTGATITHSFTTVGTQVVRMLLTDNSNLTGTIESSVVVDRASTYPVPVIAASAQQAFVGESLTFDGSGSYDLGGTVTRWEWDFGDSTFADGATVAHGFASAGTYSVELRVTNDIGLYASGAIPVTIWDRPVYDSLEHKAGFRIPVPQGWAVERDTPFEGVIVELVAMGPWFDSFQTSVIVDTDRDSTVREDEAFLGRVVTETLEDVRREAPDAILAGDPIYRVISGHLSVGFVFRYQSSGLTQKAVVVVSDPDDRYWLLLLSVSTSAFAPVERVFDDMVEGFEITSPPKGDSGASLGGVSLGTFVLAAGAGVGGAAAIGLLAFLILRRTAARRRGPSLPPFAVSPAMSHGAIAALGAVPVIHFCPRCGRPTTFPGAAFCANCGRPLHA